MNYVYQGSEADCGLASLRNYLAYYYKNDYFLNIKSDGKNDHLSFKDLILMAKRYDTTLKAYEVDYSKLIELKKPFLLLLNDNHLVMVKKITKNKVHVVCPTFGQYSVQINSFKEGKHKILMIENEKTQFHIKFKLNNCEILPKRHLIVTSFLSIMMSLSLFTSLFFVKQNSYIFLPIIFLVLFAVFNILDNNIQLKLISYFDQRYLKLYCNNQKTLVKDYSDYTEFKRDYFSSHRNVLLSIISITLVTIVLLLNDLKFAVPLLFIIIISFILFILRLKVFKKRQMRITKLEKIDSANLEDNLVKLIDANKEANLCVKEESIFKMLMMFVLIIISFLTMCAFNMTSVNFILFHFGMFYIFENSLEAFYKMLFMNSNYKMRKQRFIDKCFY